jgi:uncharacterized damage-inducible protein DinB
MANVDLSRVPEFFHKYINLVAENDLSKAFQEHQTGLISFLKQIPAENWSYRYAPGKWSIAEVVQHIIDAERIFCYRALCIARKDKTSFPGFEEDDYAAASKADKRTKEELMDELSAVQRSTMLLFASFDEEMLEENGISNGKPVYVKAIGNIIIGHGLHHKNILSERYLQEKTITL